MKGRRILITVSAAVFLLTTIIGMILRMKMPDAGLADLTSWEELAEVDITIRNENADRIIQDQPLDQVEEQIFTDLQKADLIVLVEVMDELSLTGSAIGQKVMVIDVVKGKLAEGEEFEFFTSNHISIENGEVFYLEWYNYMIPGQKYLVFLQENGLNDYQKDKTFQTMEISFGFPAYYPIDYELEQDNGMENLNFRDNRGRLLFTDNQAIVHVYGKIQNKILNKTLSFVRRTVQ